LNPFNVFFTGFKIFIDGSNADAVFSLEDQIGGGGAEVPI
jgi:hypothetical protein